MDYARAIGYAIAARLSRMSLSLPLVARLSMSGWYVKVVNVIVDMDYARTSHGLLWCLLNKVWYVRFPPYEGLSPHRVVQHVLLLDEHPVIHLWAVNPLEEVVSHLGPHM